MRFWGRSVESSNSFRGAGGVLRGSEGGVVVVVVGGEEGRSMVVVSEDEGEGTCFSEILLSS